MMAAMPRGNNSTMEIADLHDSSENWAGAAFYSGKTLLIYDLLVLRFSNRWAWKCPTSKQLAFFEKNLSPNHLDVGVGSGYYTSSCNYPGNPQRMVTHGPQCGMSEVCVQANEANWNFPGLLRG